MCLYFSLDYHAHGCAGQRRMAPPHPPLPIFFPLFSLQPISNCDGAGTGWGRVCGAGRGSRVVSRSPAAADDGPACPSHVARVCRVFVTDNGNGMVSWSRRVKWVRVKVIVILRGTSHARSCLNVVVPDNPPRILLGLVLCVNALNEPWVPVPKVFILVSP